ncbi:MAG: hypothetical protein ACI4QZ_08130 [Eubacteriales bacterium]
MMKKFFTLRADTMLMCMYRMLCMRLVCRSSFSEMLSAGQEIACF